MGLALRRCVKWMRELCSSVAAAVKRIFKEALIGSANAD